MKNRFNFYWFIWAMIIGFLLINSSKTMANEIDINPAVNVKCTIQHDDGTVTVNKINGILVKRSKDVLIVKADDGVYALDANSCDYYLTGIFKIN